MGIRSLIGRHVVATYFALAFGISWLGIALVTAPTGIPDDGTNADRLFPFVFLAMAAGPSLAGVMLTVLIDGKAGIVDLASRLGRWRVAGRWYAMALLTTPLMLVAILGVLSLLAPAYTPTLFLAGDKAGLLVLGVVGGLAAGFFEELGWTGFATPRMLRRHGVMTVGLALGVTWAFWHLLADYWFGLVTYQALYVPHFLSWVVALAAYRTLMTWVYSRTRSVLVGQLMHASFTGSQMLLVPVAVTVEENMFWYAIFALSLWIVVAIVALASSGLRVSTTRQVERDTSLSNRSAPLLPLVAEYDGHLGNSKTVESSTGGKKR